MRPPCHAGLAHRNGRRPPRRGALRPQRGAGKLCKAGRGGPLPRPARPARAHRRLLRGRAARGRGGGRIPLDRGVATLARRVADKLDTYRAKRDFERTAEPSGKRRGKPKGARFVVQEHHARRLHWDLRMEHDGVAVSWALPRGVPAHPDENRLAVHTEDHPLEYLEFEGEIPKGEYGAGAMGIWDAGTYEAEKFRDDEVILTFAGERVEGRYALFQTDGKNWMIHRMDPPADPEREPMPDRLP